MAKKVWSISEDKLTITRLYEGEVEDLTVALVDLFPTIEEMDEAQQGCILNGAKQKLSDTIARNKDEQLTEPEKREAQETLWDRLKDDRKWNLEKSGTRAGSVSLKVVVPGMIAGGMKPEAIAKMLGKSLEDIQKYASVTKKKA